DLPFTPPPSLFPLPASRYPLPAPRSPLPASRIFVPQRRHRPHPQTEILFAHPLVGRVCVFSWQSKPHQQNGRAEYALEVTDDRNRPAFASDHRLLSGRRAQRPSRRVENRSAQLSAPWPPAVK